MNKLLQSALIAGAIAIAPLGKTHAQAQASSKQIATTLSQNPYQDFKNTIEKNDTISPEIKKTLINFTTAVEKENLAEAQALFDTHKEGFKTLFKTIPGGKTILKNYLVLKTEQGGENKQIFENQARINQKKETVTVKKQEGRQLDETVDILNTINIEIKTIGTKNLSDVQKKELIKQLIQSYKGSGNPILEKNLTEIEKELGLLKK